MQFIWQYEPLLVLLWALGFVEDLFFPDHICDVPASTSMDGGVVMERHRALNWLISGDAWDEVDLST
ncbi:DUF4272 domain-containing protein [bacterium 210917-SL.2.15]|nr:DUF4272 domain-containing protein [bacterium 210917-SL.2.15]